MNTRNETIMLLNEHSCHLKEKFKVNYLLERKTYIYNKINEQTNINDRKQKI